MKKVLYFWILIVVFTIGLLSIANTGFAHIPHSHYVHGAVWRPVDFGWRGGGWYGSRWSEFRNWNRSWSGNGVFVGQGPAYPYTAYSMCAWVPGYVDYYGYWIPPHRACW